MSPATSTPTPIVNLVAKSQLARLLATENMSVEHSLKATTASFDTNTRRLTLPIWSKASEDLYDMLVAHEVGHALITPRQDVYLPICNRVNPSNPNAFFPYLNVVEDIRVDNEIRGRFPGVRASYFRAYKELADKDFFDIAKHNGDLSSLSFGDRVNIYSKIGHLGFVNVPFTAEEQIVVDEAMRADTFEKVSAVAEKIWNMSSRQDDEQEGPEPTRMPVDVSGDSGDGSGAGKAVDSDQDENESPAPGKQSSASDGQAPAPSNPTKQTAPDLSTVSTLDKNLGDLTSKRGYNYSYNDCPRLNFDNIIFPYKRVMSDLAPMRGDPGFSGDVIFSRIENRNKNFVANLVKQFEQKMAADEARRTRVAKSGRLDMRKIATYKFNEDLFVKNQIVANGKNHGMVFILDWSGSMSNYLLPTVEQLLSLCLFCRKMQIPFDVYAFTNCTPNGNDGYGSVKEEFDKVSASKDYTIRKAKSYYGEDYEEIDTGRFVKIQSFGMIHFLSSKMSTREFKDAAEQFCQCARNNDCSGSDLARGTSYTSIQERKYSLSSTPLNESIYCAIDIVNKFKADNRLDIVNTFVLTDGEPTSTITNLHNGVAILNLPNRRQMKIYDPANHKIPFGGGVAEMVGMAEVFREMTGTNIISIRLSSSREANSLADMWSMGNLKESNRMKQEWKENDFFSYRAPGFTESFVIDAKTEVLDDADVLGSVKDDASIGVITRTFIRNNAKKASSRVLLARFSDLIARKVLA